MAATGAAGKSEGGKFSLPSATVSKAAPPLLSSRPARASPRAGPRQTPPKRDAKKDIKGKAKEMKSPLPSAASLLSLASANMAEAAKLETKAESVHEQSLERQIGAAIVALNKSPAEAIREWQASQGKLTPIELRQAVRNRLKIRADNKAIDAMFASLDTNHSGALDAAQIQAAVKRFSKATKDANKEAEQLKEAASLLRPVAEQAKIAGEAVALIELRTGAGGDSEPECETAEAPPSLKQRVVLTVLEAGLSSDKLMSMWDKDRKGTMTSKQLIQALRDLKVQAMDAEIAELHSELAATTNASQGAPLSTKLVVRHLLDLAKAEGVRNKEREGELKRMRKDARQLIRELEEAQLKCAGALVVDLAAAQVGLESKDVHPSADSATGSEHSSPLSSPGGTIQSSARKPQPGQAAPLW